jgi:hypothetical protein
MQELMFCRNSSLNAIFVKPTKVSNDKIQECMCLGKDSINGLKFDIDSRGISHLIISYYNSSLNLINIFSINLIDIKEHYIIAVVKDLFNERFTHGLEESSKKNNPDILCRGISVDKAKHLLNLAQSCSANMGSGEQRFEQIIQSANSMKSPICILPTVRNNGFAASALQSNLLLSVCLDRSNIVNTRTGTERAKQLLNCAQNRLTNLNNGCDQQIIDLTSDE